MIDVFPSVLANSPVLRDQAIILALRHQSDYRAPRFASQTQFVLDSRCVVSIGPQKDDNDVRHSHPFLDSPTPLIIVLRCGERLILQDKFAMPLSLADKGASPSTVLFELERQKHGSGRFAFPPLREVVC